MALLIAGLILFLGAHSTRVFADDWRTRTMERIGELKWKGLVTALSIAGFVLLIVGYDQARMTPIVLWQPPIWTRHVAVLFNLLAFILLAAAYVPRNIIKSRIGHPMIAGVKIWSRTPARQRQSGRCAALWRFPDLGRAGFPRIASPRSHERYGLSVGRDGQQPADARRWIGCGHRVHAVAACALGWGESVGDVRALRSCEPPR